MARSTRQHEAILAALRRSTRPVTVGEIHTLARHAVPRLGMATVYRALKRLGAEGRIVGIDLPGQPLRYEFASGEHHTHLVCRGCGRVFDLPPASPPSPADIPEGFTIQGGEVIFYGLCASCGRRR